MTMEAQGRRRGRLLPYWLSGCLLGFAIWLLYAPLAPSHPYAYDEADYMFAGTRGFVANYLERPSISGFAFLEKGLELWRDRGKRGAMSQFIRSSGDITFYRHFHGPIYFYWLAFCHAAGLQQEASYRAASLLLHLLAVAVVLLVFPLVFGELPWWSGLIAAAALALNRTALITGLSITQHAMFLFTSAAVVLMMGRFCRDLEPRWWYAAAASMALAFASLETSIVLIAAMGLVLVLLAKRLRAKWKIRQIATLIGKGAGVFLLTLLVVWPKGLLTLSLAKGYLYLVYITVSRKTFSPIAPLDLWVLKLTTSPGEFLLPVFALLVTGIGWKRLQCRWEALPALTYTVIFLLVTLRVTVPYTHYHGSLMVCLAILSGVAVGELWQRFPVVPVRALLVLLPASSLVWMTAQYLPQARDYAVAHQFSSDVLAYLKQSPPAGQKLHVPYILVPTLHYYHPELAAEGYDTEPAAELVRRMKSDEGDGRLVCETSVCRAVEQILGDQAGPLIRIAATGPSGREALSVLSLRR